MLPKVATHILHSTSRAAASIQSHTIRNVLQLQSSGPQNSTHLVSWNNSSNWGSGSNSHGASSGGAKYGTGSRFFYNGAGRAVTQANAASTNDGSFHQSDETEEAPKRSSSIPVTKKSRLRSSSLSLPSQGQSERAEKLSVLKTVQLHARSKQTFAPNSSIPPQQLIEGATGDNAPAPRPTILRRNSTSSPPLPQLSQSISTQSSAPIRHNATLANSDHAAGELPPSLLHVPESTAAPTPPNATDTQTVDPPVDVKGEVVKSPERVLLEKALAMGEVDHDAVIGAVRTLRFVSTSPTVSEFNYALSVLLKIRKPGDTLHFILETYNDMLKRSLYPTLWTYQTLMEAFLARDREVQTIIHSIQRRHTQSMEEQQRVEVLQQEGNFASAMSIFEAILQLDGNGTLNGTQYASLLRACAYQAAVESAKHVFAQLRARSDDIQPTPLHYSYLLQTYSNAGNLNGAIRVFDEYRSEMASGRLHTKSDDPPTANRAVVQIWNQMIEAYFRNNQPDKAVGILEQMMDVTPDTANLNTPSPVATSTFTTLIAGFIQMGDVETALSWFDRLLQQRAAPNKDPYHPFGYPAQPDSSAWSLMIDGLARSGKVDDLNRLYAARMPSAFKQVELNTIFTANILALPTYGTEQALSTLQFLTDSIIPELRQEQQAKCIAQVYEVYIEKGMYQDGLDIFTKFADTQLEAVGSASAPEFLNLQSMQLSFSHQLYQKSQGQVPFVIPLELARLAARARIIQPTEHTAFFLQSYAVTRRAQVLPTSEMTVHDWELLLYAAIEVESASLNGTPIHDQVPNYVFEGIVSLLGDIANSGISVDSMDANLLHRIGHLLIRLQAVQVIRPLFANVSPSFSAMINSIEASNADADGTSDSGYSSGTAVSEQPNTLTIDVPLTKAMNAELRKTTPTAGVMAAYALFCIGIEGGKAPTPAVLALTIQNLGRINQMEEVRHAYTVAQTVLQSLESKKSWQLDSWFSIEDSMVIALAHHGDVDSAHLHRLRILEYGRAPSADAYGALIYNVKDTTDDASNALTLFEESQREGVLPNQYLFNNIISKLARARKADHALELFQQMKANSVPPTSVTYGAIIGACARVGDVASAETLFAEMVSSKNFRPRVPPFNTMIQMYTTTKPSREMALHYYQELLKANIKPSAYTYKLLLDAYGSIEPVDIKGMEGAFAQLQNDPEAQLQGNHFASLINAYGCVQKNLDKARETFESVPTSGRPRLLDAVVFESMINALVANKRTDLIPEYMEKMKQAGVHMTAYIANFLIKGYALAGDMVKAREMFESLEDPAQGVAAPNNRAPHDPSQSPAVDAAAPVYREPSTWEAMVRAELGSGNRDGALELLERLRERQYPEAVFNRISGIMVDHSLVLP